jgi:osmotically-inducible protein OsmY
MNRLKQVVPITLLVAAASLIAQNRQERKPHIDSYVAGTQGESRLIEEVRHHLVMLPYYGVFDDLGFVVNDGVVTLVGQVTRPTLKDDAGRTVERVEGVISVINERSLQGDLWRLQPFHSIWISGSSFDTHPREKRERSSGGRGG